MRVTPIHSIVLLSMMFSTTVAEDENPQSILSFSPPFKSRSVDLLEYVAGPSVIRHQVVAIDVVKLVELLETVDQTEKTSVSIPVVLPLFEDVSSSVRFHLVRNYGDSWRAELFGDGLGAESDVVHRVRGHLELNLKTGGVLASIGWDRRIFAIHFTGDGPYHLVVENDPEHMPAFD